MKCFWTIACLFAMGAVQAQDVLLTQFDRMTQLYNPALTGMIDGDIRFQAQYRNQWPGIGKAYVSSMFSAEWNVSEDPVSQNRFALGMMVFNEQAGTVGLLDQQIRLTAATALHPNHFNEIAFGLQAAYMRRSLDFSSLKWDAQYNGVAYDAALDNLETIGGNTQQALDAGAGISWRHNKKRQFRLSYGVFHFMQDRAFSNGKDPYRFRHALSYDLKVRTRLFDLKTMALFSAQSGAYAVSLGALAMVRSGMDSRYTAHLTSSVFMAGVYMRYRDAITPVVGVKYKQFGEVLLGYDVTLTSLRTTNRYRGGWEISLRYDLSLAPGRRRLK